MSWDRRIVSDHGEMISSLVVEANLTSAGDHTLRSPHVEKKAWCYDYYYDYP